jgi:acetoin utilization protein AcuB
MKDTMIGEHMIKHPCIVDPTMDLQSAAELLKDKGIRHLPVVQNRKLLGLISERDLKAALALPQSKLLTLGDIMVGEVFVVPSTARLSDVAFEMADRKFGSAVIVNEKKHVVGIFTTTDALRILADLAENELMSEFFDEDSDFEEWPVTVTARDSFLEHGKLGTA